MLELIRLCNIENNKLKDNDMLLKFSKNNHCPYCSSSKICKIVLQVKHNNLDVVYAATNYSLKPILVLHMVRNQQHYGKNTLNYFHQVYYFVRLLKKMENQISLPTAFYQRYKIYDMLLLQRYLVKNSILITDENRT